MPACSPQPLSREDLLGLVEDAPFWKIDLVVKKPDKVYTLQPTNELKSALFDPISLSAFAVFDPALPEILQYMCSVEPAWVLRGHADQAHLRTLLKFLALESQPLPAAALDEHALQREDVYICQLMNIDWSSSLPKRLLLSYTDYITHKTELGIPYAMEIGTDFTALNLQWLDAQCPDWEHRLATAQALDLPHGEKARYVMQSLIEPGVSPGSDSSVSVTVPHDVAGGSHA